MIDIRRAVKEDFEVLEELYRELEEDGVFYQPQHFVLSPKGARSEYMAGILGSDNQALFVAEDDGKVIMQMDPIPLGTNSNGQNVMVSISGVIRAKAMGASSLDSNAQRAEIKNIVRETLTRELAPNINSMGDLKFLMLTANRLNPVVIEAIKARGYEAAFTMPLVIRPVQ